jgi:transcriptional regulator with XRE-family HTH domain
MPVKPEDKADAAKLRRVLGARIREAREELGWSQERLAEEIGVGVEMLGRYERAAKFPSPVSLVRLSRVLRVSIDVLLGLAPSSGSRKPQGSALERMVSRLTSSQQAAVVLVLRELTVPYGKARSRRPSVSRRKAAPVS